MFSKNKVAFEGDSSSTFFSSLLSFTLLLLLPLFVVHHLLRVLGGKKKGLPAHGEINAFFPQKTTLLEISLLWRGEILHLRVTIVSKGKMISTRKFLHLCPVVVPLLVFLSHS